MTSHIDHKVLSQALLEFVRQRDWEKFHSPKNLVMALSSEMGELSELFQWISEEESYEIKNNPEKLTSVSHEIADILMYLIRLSDVLSIDLNHAVKEKIAINNAKYPADKVKGKANKYTEYT